MYMSVKKTAFFLYKDVIFQNHTFNFKLIFSPELSVKHPAQTFLFIFSSVRGKKKEKKISLLPTAVSFLSASLRQTVFCVIALDSGWLVAWLDSAAAAQLVIITTHSGSSHSSRTPSTSTPPPCSASVPPLATDYLIWSQQIWLAVARNSSTWQLRPH